MIRPLVLGALLIAVALTAGAAIAGWRADPRPAAGDMGALETTGQPAAAGSASPSPRPSAGPSPIDVSVAALRGLGRVAFPLGDELWVMDGDRSTISGIEAKAGEPAWSFDGQWLAFHRPAADGNVEVWLSRGDGSLSHPVRSLPPARTYRYKWSPTAEVLAVVPEEPRSAPNRAGLWLATPEAGAAPVGAIDGQVWSFAWAPDGTSLAYSVTLPFTDLATRSDALYTIRIDDPRPVQRIVAPSTGIGVASWWPSGEGVLFHPYPGHSASLGADGLRISSLRLGDSSASDLGVIANGPPAWIDAQRFAVVEGGGRFYTGQKRVSVCDVEAARCRRVAQPSGVIDVELVVSSGAAHIAFVRAAARGDEMGFRDDADFARWRATRELWIADVDTLEARRFAAAGTGVFAPSWVPGSRSLVYVRGRTVWIAEMSTGAERKLVGGLPEPTAFGGNGWYPAWSRGGSTKQFAPLGFVLPRECRIGASTPSGRRHLWSLDCGSTSADLPLLASAAAAQGWSPCASSTTTWLKGDYAVTFSVTSSGLGLTESPRWIVSC